MRNVDNGGGNACMGEGVYGKSSRPYTYRECIYWAYYNRKTERKESGLWMTSLTTVLTSQVLLSHFDSVRPHRHQPTRLRRPWDSPGKNTGVGCHFLLQCVKVKSLSHVRLLATPWTAAHQTPPSTGFSRQEYWSGVPLPSPLPGTWKTKYACY